MKLGEWLEKENISREIMAQVINKTVQAVGYYVNGIKIPRPETMAKIVAYTKGEVTANDFYGIEEKSDECRETRSRRCMGRLKRYGAY